MPRAALNVTLWQIKTQKIIEGIYNIIKGKKTKIIKDNSAARDKLEPGKLELSRKNQERSTGSGKVLQRKWAVRSRPLSDIRNMKTQENDSSNKDLDAVKCLFSHASINIPDASIDWWHGDSTLYSI